MSNPVQNRARYLRLKAEGRCVGCGERLPDRSHTRCEKCREVTKEWRRTGQNSYRVRRTLSGVCAYCGEPKEADGFVNCADCRKEMRRLKAQWVDRSVMREVDDTAPGCPRCGLRGEHVCLRGSATERRAWA